MIVSGDVIDGAQPASRMADTGLRPVMAADWPGSDCRPSRGTCPPRHEADTCAGHPDRALAAQWADRLLDGGYSDMPVSVPAHPIPATAHQLTSPGWKHLQNGAI